jgi:transposase
LIYSWINKYQENGLDGLKSNTGKSQGGNKGIGVRKPKNRIEELELEIMKKDIEIARLKKGYNVKGVGQKKEFVTTFNKNTK